MLPQTLQNLRLEGVRDLESVFDEEASESLAMWRSTPAAATTSFSLQQISVKNCPQLKKIFPQAGKLDYLRNIQSITVERCDELEEIISSELEEEPL